ncbi:MAG: iron-containing alcohol dehydrogenase [Candidatus Cloacimonetes bacterium]|nr:iron-containing alcohol dehydrogenase [Candidatus Cloacimonadota bacterium]
MKFHIPTRVFFGTGALSQASPYIANLGIKALIVTGRTSARKSGALDDVMQLLDSSGIKWHLHDRIGENPDLEMVISGKQDFLDHGCDFVIAIGGGSPIDAAKAISLAAANDLDLDHIYDTASFLYVFPLVAIPTTAGTGTEVTPYSVLTDARPQKKAGFGSDLAFPAIAVIDPNYTISQPDQVTLNTGIDALSHLLEGIYSIKRNPLLYPLIFEGIRLIIENLPLASTTPDDYHARESLAKASMYGGMTIAHTSTTLHHSIGYPLTSVHNVPHGLANGIVLKPMMDLFYPAVSAILDRLWIYLGINRRQFYDWIDGLDMKADLHLDEEFMAQRIPEVLASRNMANNPFEVTAAQIRVIYQSL